MNAVIGAAGTSNVMANPNTLPYVSNGTNRWITAYSADIRITNSQIPSRSVVRS